MTSKVKGTEGIEFPDSTVQASAAYSKAESDAKFVPKVGQTWQAFSVPSERALNTNYTNSTGKPIQVTARGSNAIAAGFMDMRINVSGFVIAKSVISTSVGGEEVFVTATVPSGAEYSINFTGNNSPAINSWMELR